MARRNSNSGAAPPEEQENTEPEASEVDTRPVECNGCGASIEDRSEAYLGRDGSFYCDVCAEVKKVHKHQIDTLHMELVEKDEWGPEDTKNARMVLDFLAGKEVGI